MSQQATATATPVVEREPESESKTRHAPRYRVFIHNDDVTPMDFVVHVLCEFFRKQEPDAIEIMLRAHTKSLALVDTLPLEQAEFRVDQAHALARPRKYPLKFTYEPEE